MKILRSAPQSKTSMLILFLCVICLCFTLFAEGTPAEGTAGTDSSQELTDQSAELVQIMNLNLRYILNT